MHLSCRILVIEDEELFAQNLCDFLVRRRAQVRVALSAEDGLAAAAEFAPEVVLIDYSLPGMNGMEAFSRLKGARDSLRGILMTGHAAEPLEAAARAVGIDHILSKPFPLAELRRVLLHLAPARSRESNAELPRVGCGHEAERRGGSAAWIPFS